MVGSEAALQLAVDRLNSVRREIAKIIVGQDDVVEGVLICLLASGTSCWKVSRDWGRRLFFVPWRAPSN